MFAYRAQGLTSLISAIDENGNAIALETCTAEHFDNIDTLDTIFSAGNEITQWTCLPLNQQYELGRDVSKNELKFIQMSFNCTGGSVCMGSGSPL